MVTQPGATVSGELRLEAHNRQSYDVHVTLRAPPLAPGGPEQASGPCTEGESLRRGWRSLVLLRAEICAPAGPALPGGAACVPLAAV